MDFGVVGFDNLACPDSASFALENAVAESYNKHKCGGSAFLKRESPITEDELRDFKLAKTSSISGYGCTSASMQGARGSFSPSQWMELEHQALIYKYITSNVPIPSHLLNPIRKGFQSAFPSIRTNSLGWGGLHLGYCSNNPEPGRCRRTDGKKWRCAKEAVADQKYCERHMNRGRHRSRKPMEGHSSATSNNTKLTPTAPSTSASPAPPVSNAQHHFSTVQPGYNLQAYQQKTVPNKNPPSEFGLVCYYSLLDGQGSRPQQFIDDWPNIQGDRATQLSISIPMAASDFRPAAASSPANRKVSASSSSQELDMGLGMGNAKAQKRVVSWVPISWESPMGGPLGEALHAVSNTVGDNKNAKPLNLSPRLASSPTGVSQRADSSKRLDGASRCIGFMGPGAVMNPSLPAL